LYAPGSANAARWCATIKGATAHMHDASQISLPSR
jgi:hypothetical protein